MQKNGSVAISVLLYFSHSVLLGFSQRLNVGNSQALFRKLNKKVEDYILLVVLSTGVLKSGDNILPAVHLVF